MNSEQKGSFSDLGLSENILASVNQLGFTHPTPIQMKSIPVLLSGKDVLGTAQTGTGKTAAFALPILNHLKPGAKKPSALVLVPTRELAIQVAQSFSELAQKIPGVRIEAIYGGQSIVTQLKALRKGVDVIVGTPGRITDHLKRETLDLSQIKTLILDEADEMLRMGFIDEVSWILERTPQQKQVGLFSATMPEAIRRIAANHLHNPEVIKVKAEKQKKSNIKQMSWVVRHPGKFEALNRLLSVEDYDAVIIFVRTKQICTELADKLAKFGYRVSAINGDMNQAHRERTISQVKKGDIDLLIATDVAARGIDVERITHVFNYHVPFDAESYVHRIGRTGRAGRTGKAIVFVTQREKRLLKSLEKATAGSIELIDIPSVQEINNKRRDDYKAQIIQRLEKPVAPDFVEMVESMLKETGYEAKHLACVLAEMAQNKNLPLLFEVAKEVDHNFKKEDATLRKKKTRVEGQPTAEIVPMERFRLGVGRNHKIKPGDIVGAISNEADIDSQYIGKIILHDEFSTVDLPQGMPEEVFGLLKKTFVRQHKLKIEREGKADNLEVLPVKRSKKRKPLKSDQKAGLKPSKKKFKSKSPK